MNETTEQRPLTAAQIAQLDSTHEMSRFSADEARLTRNPQTGRIIRSPDYGPDDQLVVKFTIEPQFSKVDTIRAGGVPQYRDVEYVTIYAPGQVNELTVHTPVTDFYQWRFPVEYAAFKKGLEAAVVGIPLIHWPEITPALLKELEYHGIRTVEQVASLPESVGGALRGLRGLKPKAIAFLDRSKQHAASAELEQKLQAERDKFAAEIEAMKTQMKELLALKQSSEIEEVDGQEQMLKKDSKGRFTKKD